MAQNKGGSTPLHIAAWAESVVLARLLIEHGADVTARNEEGLTPLHFAVLEGTVELARLLVEHGADVTTQDNEGRLRCIW
jgi:ankyrin repeat protein